MAFQLTLTEAAQFSQASVADYHADRTANLQAFARDARKAQARKALVAHVVLGVVAFAAVFGGALVALAAGII